MGHGYQELLVALEAKPALAARGPLSACGPHMAPLSCAMADDTNSSL